MLRENEATAHEICASLAQNIHVVRTVLAQMRACGLVDRARTVEGPKGRQVIVYRVTGRAIAIQAERQDVVPRWVPSRFRPVYAEIARVLGEEIAADYARKAKARAAAPPHDGRKAERPSH